MRDGDGKKLTDDETAKVKSTEVKPGEDSLNKVSIDPKPGKKPIDDMGDEPEAAETTNAPKVPGGTST